MNKKILIKGGHIVGVKEVLFADLLIQDGLIKTIEPSIEVDESTQVINASDKYILPGFIDIHNHGAAGFDTSFGKYILEIDKFDLNESAYKNGLKDALDFYLKTGVTKVLLTTMAAPLDRLNLSFKNLCSFLEENVFYKKLVHGINLEGTFLKDPDFAGAQNPKYFYELDYKTICELQKSSEDLLKVINIPPEHGEKGFEIIRKLKNQGIVVAGGHTAAYGDEYSQAVAAGLNLSVHFLNGPSRSSSKSFRMGGAVESMLRSDEVFLEIICDGYHIDPSYVRDAITRKGHQRIIMITDSMFANRLPKLEKFELFGLEGVVSKNKEYLQVLGSENTLFGSVLSSDVGFGNVVSWLTKEMIGTWHRVHKALSINNALVIASAMFSSNPARLLGIYDEADNNKGTGSIETGKKADLIIAELKTGKLCVDYTIIEGAIV